MDPVEELLKLLGKRRIWKGPDAVVHPQEISKRPRDTIEKRVEYIGSERVPPGYQTLGAKNSELDIIELGEGATEEDALELGTGAPSGQRITISVDRRKKDDEEEEY